MQSVFDNIKVVKAVAPVAQAAVAATSAAIDTVGYNSLMVNAQAGAATGTPDSYTVIAKVQECATSGGSYVDISGATATIAADSTSAQIRVDGLNLGSRLRYIKVVLTAAFVNGTSPKALISSSVLLGGAVSKPVGNSSTPA